MTPAGSGTLVGPPGLPAARSVSGASVSMTKTSPDPFSSDAGQMVAADGVHFPLAVAVRKGTYEAAVQTARLTLDALRRQVAGLNLGPVEVVTHQLRCLPEAKGTARLELTAGLDLRWSAELGGFWERADGVARALDLFGHHPAGSADVSVTVGPVNHRAEVGGK